MTDTTLMTASTDSPASSDEAVIDAPAEAGNEDANQQAPAEDAKDEPAEAGKTEGDEAKDEKEDDEPKGAPEAYEDFTAPDGVELDTEVLGEFQALGKELDLPQEQAQKVVDLGTKLAQKWAAQQAESVQALHTEWVDASKADKEFGGDALPVNLATAKKAVETYGTPELRELLDQSGLGNHPEVIRLFVRVGKTISEDTHVAGGNGTSAKGAAETLYPNQK